MIARNLHLRILAFFLATVTLSGIQATGAAEKVLHRFSPFPHGDSPGGLIADPQGNFYGVARGGLYDAGVIYKLTPDSNGSVSQTVLYNFTGGLDGGEPVGIVPDGAGNIYGFANSGGANSLGTFFELTPAARGEWKEVVLYNLTDARTEPIPNGPSMDKAGNFYGQTYEWGGSFGYGFVFELTRSPGGTWSETVIYTFSGGTDGGAPFGQFAFDHRGDLYGTAALGGSSKGGVVFELTPSSGGTWTESVVYNFMSGADGSFPASGLVADQAGDLYGTTGNGGNASGCGPSGGCGTVFELKPGSGGVWTESVLYSFGNTEPLEGVGPSLVTLDAAGNLFGATYQGGSGRNCNNGCGTVFELSPGGNGQWTASVLHNFTGADASGFNPGGTVVLGSSGRVYGTTSLGGRAQEFNGTIFETTPNSDGHWTTTTAYGFPTSDGDVAFSNLIADAAGNLYGTTLGGGIYNLGTAFELSPTSGRGWEEQILYNFDKPPLAGLAMDSAGNLYGTTVGEGAGEVFMLSAAAGGGWTETPLYTFTGSSGKLVFDSAGNLYGTSSLGGRYNSGTVFKLTRGSGGEWTASVIHDFMGYPVDGAAAEAGVAFDAVGNIYGTTARGGISKNCLLKNGPPGCGTVFELSPGTGGTWAETVLYSFTNSAGDGAYPFASVVLDDAGNLYGTTRQGGIAGNCSFDRLQTCGTVFELSPTGGGLWAETVLHAFAGTTAEDGAIPEAGLTLDHAGNLYGTTQAGGTFLSPEYPQGLGTVFKLTPSSGGWTETIVHNFGSLTDGSLPHAGLFIDSQGNLYGTTAGDVNGGSVVFEIAP